MAVRGTIDMIPLGLGGLAGLTGHSVAKDLARMTPGAKWAGKIGAGAMIASGSYMMAQGGTLRQVGQGVGAMGMTLLLLGAVDLFLGFEEDAPEAIEAVRGLIPFERTTVVKHTTGETESEPV